MRYFFKYIKVIFVIIVIGISSLSYAEKNDKPPTFQDVKERVRYLEQHSDKSITCEKKKGADVCYRRQGDLIEGVGSIVVPAEAKVAKGIVGRYNDHDLYFKDVYGSDIIKWVGSDKFLFHQKVRVPIIEDRDVIVIVRDVGEGFFWYYPGPGKIREGSISGGNMTSGYGAWIFEPLDDPKECRAKFYVHSQPLLSTRWVEDLVPDFVLDHMAQDTLPGTVAELRDIVIHYDEWFDEEGNLREEKKLARQK